MNDQLPPLPKYLADALKRMPAEAPSEPIENALFARLDAALGFPIGQLDGISQPVDGSSVATGASSTAATAGAGATGTAATVLKVGAVKVALGAWGIPATIAALVVGAAGGSVGHSILTRHPAIPDSVSAGPARQSPEVVEHVSVPAPEVKVAAPQRRPVAAPPKPTSTAQERLVLEAARSALTRNDPLSALEQLHQHQIRFPRALLREEREALRIQALVVAGRFEDARVRQAEFAKEFPDSILREAVEATMKSIP